MSYGILSKNAFVLGGYVLGDFAIGDSVLDSEGDIGIFGLEHSFNEFFGNNCCIYFPKSNVGYNLPTKHLIFLFVFICSVLEAAS